MGVKYTTVARMLDMFPSLGSASTVTSAQTVVYIEHAESEIDAKIARMWTLPLTSVPGIIQTIASEIAMEKMMSQRIMLQSQLKDSVWPKSFARAYELLDEIASGQYLLVDSAGAILAQQTSHAPIITTTDGYLPAVADGITNPVDWQIDRNKVEDAYDERVDTLGGGYGYRITR